MILEASNFLGDQTPMQKIEQWVNELKGNLKEPNAMTITTASPDGQPSSRVVLAREFTRQGIIFYTNYQSAKGIEISKNPKVAGQFFWDQPQRQIRFQGDIQKISEEKSDAYWNQRHRDSQLSQWVSKQSQFIASREQMEQELQLAIDKFKDQNTIPRPQHWGGYEVVTKQIEFWIGHPHRFHDRFIFTLSPNQWLGQRLYP